MNYFQISFHYQGPCANLAEDDQANEALYAVEKKWALIKLELENEGTKFLHGYFWSDGSFYKYCRTDKTMSELKDCLQPHMSASFCLDRIHTEDPKSDPWKLGCKTLEQYFEQNFPTKKE